MSRKAQQKKARKLAHAKRRQEEEVARPEPTPEPTHEEKERAILSTALSPPYNVILDTNFINDCIRKKQDLEDVLISCLHASVELLVPECVIAELEKLGRAYRVALTMLKRVNYTPLKCLHKGTYADDCILERVAAHRCYIVATSDTNLRQRIKKIPGVPIVFFRGYRCVSEEFANL